MHDIKMIYKGRPAIMPSSSEQRPTIHVQTLGGFSIRTNGCQINDNSNQSKKPWALLEYLVIFQKKDINC